MEYPGLPIMVMTAFEEEYSAGIAISVGAREFIKKPFSLDEFGIRLHKMINDSETLTGLKSGKDVDEDMQDIMEELDEVLRKR
jgi:DNA-binding response OmpR family regulator